MKKLLTIFIVLLIMLIIGIGLVISTLRTPVSQSTLSQSAPTQSPPEPTSTKKTLEYDSVPYSYHIIGPINPRNVSLHSNLPDKESSQQLKDAFNCSALTSAGFYGTNNRHIGLFLVNDTVIQEQSTNSLFNYYVWSTQSGTAGIGQLLPDEPLRFALQSGPLLLNNGTPRTLRMRIDEEARRISIGIAPNNSFYFYVVTSVGSTFSGPKLEDLPAIIDEINTIEGIGVVTVLNLDGGNHSTFQYNETSILELSPVGGIFCIK